MMSDRFGLVVQNTPDITMARSRWMAAMALVFSPATLLREIEGASRDTSVHVRVINRLVILAEWRESDYGTRYYHVLYTWTALV
jgi:hypothetical protein